jgi:hypothetical protein
MLVSQTLEALTIRDGTTDRRILDFKQEKCRNQGEDPVGGPVPGPGGATPVFVEAAPSPSRPPAERRSSIAAPGKR